MPDSAKTPRRKITNWIGSLASFGSILMGFIRRFEDVKDTAGFVAWIQASLLDPLVWIGLAFLGVVVAVNCKDVRQFWPFRASQGGTLCDDPLGFDYQEESTAGLRVGVVLGSSESTRVRVQLKSYLGQGDKEAHCGKILMAVDKLDLINPGGTKWFHLIIKRDDKFLFWLYDDTTIEVSPGIYEVNLEASARKYKNTKPNTFRMELSATSINVADD